MTRNELVEFIRMAVHELEGVKLSHDFFEIFTDEQLDREADWYAYLLEK